MAEPRGPFNSPGFWLHHAALTWRQELDARLRPLGLTHTQFDLLAAVHWLQSREGPPRQQQVADFSGADRMMASKVIATLEARALLTRHADSQDSRVKRLELTAEGRRVVRAAIRLAAEVDAALFGDGPDRERLLTELRSLARERSAA